MSCNPSSSYEPVKKFDEVFGGYCKLNEDVIRVIGQLLVVFKGSEHQVPPESIELKIRPGEGLSSLFQVKGLKGCSWTLRNSSAASVASCPSISAVRSFTP